MRVKTSNRIMAVVLGILLLLSVVGCGQNPQQAQPTPQKNLTPEEKLQAALAGVQALESVHVFWDTEMDMTNIDGDTIYRDTMEFEYFDEPLRTRVHAKNDAGSEQTHLLEYVEEDKKIYWHTQTDGEWATTDCSYMQYEIYLPHYRIKNTMEILLNEVKEFEHLGEEELNGVKADKFRIVVDQKNTEDILDAASMTGTVRNATIEYDVTSQSELFFGLEDVTATVWLDQATSLPLRFEIDLQPNVKALYQKYFDMRVLYNEIFEDEKEVTVNKATFVLDCSDFNNVEDFGEIASLMQ